MKPFFLIRVAYNPADSDDQETRDGYAVRASVARQHIYEPGEGEDQADAARRGSADDVEAIVSAIVRAMSFIDGALVEKRCYDFLNDLIFELANRGNGGLEANVLELAKIAADGCEDDFLDGLQAIIDDARKQQSRPEVT